MRVPDLPPDQRFYAGGSGTVRGYRYQSVGPQFPDGNPVGGTAMTAVNVEFRQRIGTELRRGVLRRRRRGEREPASPVAGVSHSAQLQLEHAPCKARRPAGQSGVGVGARYYTSIGPLRLDFAVPTYRRSNDDRFEVYIGLGQAF